MMKIGLSTGRRHPRFARSSQTLAMLCLAIICPVVAKALAKGDRPERAMREGAMPDNAGAACVFCSTAPQHCVAANELTYAVRDTTPVTPLHTLILPRRHVASYFDLGPDEDRAIRELLAAVRHDITTADPEVEGFNVGVNIGEVAGQTIFHCHVHLIPRRRGDVPNPRGGVRAVIPGKADY